MYTKQILSVCNSIKSIFLLLLVMFILQSMSCLVAKLGGLVFSQRRKFVSTKNNRIYPKEDHEGEEFAVGYIDTELTSLFTMYITRQTSLNREIWFVLG